MQDNILQWLISRGITKETIDLFNIHTTNHPIMGEDTIVIPVHNPDGSFAFNKYRRSPFNEHPKLPKYSYDKGSRTSLFGSHLLPNKGQTELTNIVITEGELDTLVLHSRNIQAVSSTGGAMSWQDEFTDLLAGYDVTLCFDNDDPGAQGMVKTLRSLPHAKVVFIPETPGVKDITDFLARGGDFHALLRTAFKPTDLATVEADRQHRTSQWLPVRFHDAYIKEHTPLPQKTHTHDYDTPEKERAKAYPCDKILEFTRRKALCPVHNEKTPSLNYYPKTNTCFCFGCSRYFDSIALYQAVHECDFKTALKALSK